MCFIVTTYEHAALSTRNMLMWWLHEVQSNPGTNLRTHRRDASRECIALCSSGASAALGSHIQAQRTAVQHDALHLIYCTVPLCFVCKAHKAIAFCYTSGRV